MNNQLITKEKAHQVIENGIFYYPAYEHYGNNEGNIICNFCSKSNLKCCIGYEEYDLCLKCSETIVNKQPNTELPINVMQDLYRADYIPMTRMKQDSVMPKTRMKQSSVRTMTFMMQDSIKRNVDMSKIKPFNS